MKPQDKSHKEIQKILSRRGEDQIKSFISDDQCEKIILTAANDIGVIRNGGRRGAAFGPSCIINAFKKFASHSKDNKKIQIVEVAGGELDFNQMQSLEIKNIKSSLDLFKRTHICHLGGGHDHIYPLVMAMAQHFDKKIHIINIDAHLDTRLDDFFHSGTPFRQLKNNLKNNLRVTQLGIQEISNVESNWNSIEMNVHLLSKLEEELDYFNNLDANLVDKILDIKNEELTVFSLDLDAIKGYEFSAVSAVNPLGLPLNFIHRLLSRYLSKVDIKLVGLYEYNPMFDDLAAKDAKVCAELVKQSLQV